MQTYVTVEIIYDFGYKLISYFAPHLILCNQFDFE